MSTTWVQLMLIVLASKNFISLFTSFNILEKKKQIINQKCILEKDAPSYPYSTQSETTSLYLTWWMRNCTTWYTTFLQGNYTMSPAQIFLDLHTPQDSQNDIQTEEQEQMYLTLRSQEQNHWHKHNILTGTEFVLLYFNKFMGSEGVTLREFRTIWFCDKACAYIAVQAK